jgi:hypothetical protein
LLLTLLKTTDFYSLCGTGGMDIMSSLAQPCWWKDGSPAASASSMTLKI